MANNLPFYHIHDELCHISGMVRDALQVLGNKRDSDGPRDGLRIFDHEREQFAKELLRQIVDEVVRSGDFSGKNRVRHHESIERLPYHLQRPIGHSGDVNVGFEAVANLHTILDAYNLTLVSARLRSSVAAGLKRAAHGFSKYGLVTGICQSTVASNCSEYVATYPLKLSQLEALIDG